MATQRDPQAALFWGNQSHAVNEAAGALTERLLGDLPRDFAYRAFDAEEMLKGVTAESGAEALAAFQLACETLPFLCDRYVVRLNHLQVVRMAERAVQNLQRALDELQVFETAWDGETAWAAQEELPEHEPGGPQAPIGRWVAGVEARPDGAPVVELRPIAEPDAPRFLLRQTGKQRGAKQQGAERRLVDLRGFLREKLPGRFVFPEEADSASAAPPSGSLASRLHRLLERLVKSPPEGLHLVLTARGTRESDLSRPLLTALKAQGPVEKFVTYDDYNPQDWVLREAGTRGLTLRPPQAALLIQLAGNDLGRLARELDKLALLHAGEAPPDDEALWQLVHGAQGGSLFLVNERLGNKDLPGVLDVLERFVGDATSDQLALIAIVARHVRQLLHVHALARLGVAEPEWPARLKLHPFIARRIIEQGRRFSLLELEQMLRALATLDVEVKRRSRLGASLLREFMQAACLGLFRRPGHPLTAGTAPGE